jgi:arsenite methyltransferase
MSYFEVDKRYSTLAEKTCCLSCGGAIDYASAALGEVCIDLGSGRGTDVIRLAREVGASGFVYGVDVSEGMIRKSQSIAEKLNVNNVKFLLSELENLPIESSSIDLVISNCTINHAADKQKVWFEIARIMKNGGRFVVSDIYSISPVPDKYRNDPVAVSECWAGAITRNEYMSQLTNAGFREIEIVEESEPYSKGQIKVASFTIKGKIRGSCLCCSS